MADPSPADAAEGQKPAAGEGQTPKSGEGKPAADAEGKSYPEAYVKQLRAEQKENRDRIAQLEGRLQEHEDEKKSETERLAEERDREKQRAKELRQELTRYEIAAERGLDMGAAKFLTGATREEMELRAEELGQLLQDRAKPPPPGFDGGARRAAPEPLPPEQAHNAFLLRAMGKEPQPRRAS